MSGTNNLGFDNFYSTTLSSTITASDTTIYLNALPTASEGYLVIEPDSSSNREIIYYTSKGANYVTCPSAASGRGVGGTTAVSHNSGSTTQMNTVAEMFEDIQGGSSNTGMHQYFDDSFADYIKSGGAITQATGLIASVSSGVSYINGRRLTFNGISKTLTASKDTYFDLYETDGSNIATISYTELSSGATGSTPVSNGVHLGMVRSNASVLATIYQTGFDILGNPLKKTDPIETVPPGSVVQIARTNYNAVATGTTQLPNDDTIPQITEGTEFMTLSITPKSATNLLVFRVNAWLTNSTADRWLNMALFQDATADALAATTFYAATGSGSVQNYLSHSMTAGTTSSTTFRIRAGSNGSGTVTFNGVSGGRLFGAVTHSSIEVTEYKV